MTQTTRAPRSDARANRESILAAARETLANDPRASIDVIARAAGLSRRALYGHFDDRAALVTELIATGAQRFNAIAEEPATADARLDLARLAARLWGAAEDVQLLAAVALDDEHVASTAAALAPVRRMLLEIVRQGQSAQTLRTDMDAETLARIIEEGARTFVTRAPAFTASVADARSIAVRAMLSIGGLSWRESEELLQAHPDLLSKETAR
ncbi:TetR/AcrR family transcriptional regulator [Microbacterium sp.]|uniref:TetR/AcrR family transcriptional regulator n=1 Tax=Microbacterium sp. TaxID=51671 RepID=UPI002B980A2C|nr:TetR family transcriptional regulator [Microbacterium sp.]HWK77626.1 TetR family transcriptional regulator [Microbacterium sp.]